jgi:hypothetical protein
MGGNRVEKKITYSIGNYEDFRLEFSSDYEDKKNNKVDVYLYSPLTNTPMRIKLDADELLQAVVQGITEVRK